MLVPTPDPAPCNAHARPLWLQSHPTAPCSPLLQALMPGGGASVCGQGCPGPSGQRAGILAGGRGVIYHPGAFVLVSQLRNITSHPHLLTVHDFEQEGPEELDTVILKALVKGEAWPRLLGGPRRAPGGGRWRTSLVRGGSRPLPHPGSRPPGAGPPPGGCQWPGGTPGTAALCCVCECVGVCTGHGSLRRWQHV